MKIKATKQNLLKGIQTTQNVVSSQTTLPILSNILIETNKNNLLIAATDLEMTTTTWIPVEILEEGSITIPAKRFGDIAKELYDQEDVSITVKKNNSVIIESEKCFFKIMGLPKEDFPKLPKVHTKETIAIKQNTLQEMLNLTFFAVSREETRYILNGILFEIKGATLKLVATDGRRLALVEKELPGSSSTPKKAIVPIKIIQELNKVLSSEENGVKIAIEENQISFQLQNTVLTSRLIEGEFPNYEQVIPKENKGKLVINREKFLLAAKRASLLTTPESQSIKIDFLKDKMIFTKNTPEIGEVKDEIPIENQGKEFSAGFNPRYLIDVLKNIKDEDVSFELNGPEEPGVFRAPYKYAYIVLPMQLG